MLQPWEYVNNIESCNYTTPEGEPLAMHADWVELKRLAGMEANK